MSNGLRQSVKRWVDQYWGDLKASVDPSLLALARFFGLIYGPIDRQSRFGQALRKSLARRLPSHVGWGHAPGGITYLLFMVLVGTGVLLAFYYRPSAQEAYPSVQHIVTRVTFGWLIRDLHHWGANLIVIAVLAHMTRVFFQAAYHPPRETNWVIGLVLLLVVLGFGASGYLLPWDQWAYWSTTEVLDGLAAVPVVGGVTAAAITGDEIVSGATLSRFFSIHVILLPWIALVLLSLHFTLLRKHGTSPPRGAAEADQSGVPFFPHHMLRMLIVTVLVLAVLFTFAVLFPRPVGTPANPYQAPNQLGSTWLVIDVFRGLTRFLGAWGLLAFTLVGLSLALFPLECVSCISQSFQWAKAQPSAATAAGVKVGDECVMSGAGDKI